MIEEIRNELLDHGLDDMFYLGWAVQVTSRHLGIPQNDPAIIEPTLKVIREMLEAGHIVAGQTNRNSEDLVYVRSWDMSPEDTVDRIRKEWSALGDLPTPGLVAWFELTDSGRAAARQLSR